MIIAVAGSAAWDATGKANKKDEPIHGDISVVLPACARGSSEHALGGGAQQERSCST